MYDEWGNPIDDPYYPSEDNNWGATPPGGAPPAPPAVGNWPGSGAYWTIDGKHGQNPAITSDADYGKYNYDQRTGRLTPKTGGTSTTTGGTGSGDLAADYRTATEGLAANERDQGSLNTVAERLRAMGYDVSLPPTDPQGRNQGLIINGQLHRAIDSGNNWTLVSNATNTAWGSDAGGAGGPGGTLGTFDYPEFTPPSFDVPRFDAPAPFSYPDYVGPTAANFTADPGYEFARTEGLRAMTNDAAAKGLRRTGGFEKAIGDYSTGLAAQEFGNVDARQFRNWQANRGGAAQDYDRNWANKLTTHMTDYNREADEYNRARSTYGTNFGTAATTRGFNLDAKNSQFGNMLSLYDIATRNLPRYTPTTTNPSEYGFSS